MWDTSQIVFEMLEDMTDDPVVTLMVDTPAGRLAFVAELVAMGDTLLLRGVHVQGMGPNAVGLANLRVIARTLMEGMGYDGLVVEGALRTTGASPGRRPGALRFSRGLRPTPSARPPGP